MNWAQCRNVMERRAIKTDDIAVEDAYFMATHMPFEHLEVYRGGKTTSTPSYMSEEEVFDELVYNPNNEHRLVIVRGENGSGKSHLIRYLHARFFNSPATVYNPAKEQVLFLRRLNNSVRGVLSQLIEQKAIKDPEMEAKLQRFVDSSDSKDEASFKNDILYAYIAAVSNDQSGKAYSPVECRDIASYLSDSRVKEHLLREGGAISLCYNVITAPSDKILADTSVFCEDDFNVPKIIKAVFRQGDPQAADFAQTLKMDESEIDKLISYLNRFTRDVVQKCANITSENTKSIFVQLRQDLKSQGKNLTIFIEDFTGFTGIDSELITVLSTEHGGDYANLCRVTSIIGVTDSYYKDFRGNFTDRVTDVVNISDAAYSGEDFVVQMAGRYLNAIYCAPEELETWSKNGASFDSLPINGFVPPCNWESIMIGAKSSTLYPFTKKSLVALFKALPVQRPRNFLKGVLKQQLKEFFDGKEFGEDWSFPLNPKNIQMDNGAHSSAIDRMDAISSQDRNRIKTILAIWGDGSAAGRKEADGSISYGGISKAFFEDVGLGTFSGIGDIENNAPVVKTAVSTPPTSPVPPAKDRKALEFERYRNDITSWFSSNTPLQYHADYRKWLQAFLCGSNQSCGAINWQDIGVPAFVAAQRLNSYRTIFIAGQDNAAESKDAIIQMDRSSESKDTLLALAELNRFGDWTFTNAAYYQERLITWLERNKAGIIKNVLSSGTSEKPLPVLKWCLALQYLRAMIYGLKVDVSTPLNAVESLFGNQSKDGSVVRNTKEWSDLVSFVQSKSSEFDTALGLLQKASATTMGSIQFSKDASEHRFFRSEELLQAAEELIACDWDIQNELPDSIPDNNFLYNPVALLKRLYKSISSVMAAERIKQDEVLERLGEHIGDYTETNLVNTFSTIQGLFTVFNENGIPYSSELKIKFDSAPIKVAKEIIDCVDVVNSAKDSTPVEQLTAYSGNVLHAWWIIY